MCSIMFNSSSQVHNEKFAKSKELKKKPVAFSKTKLKLPKTFNQKE